MKNRVSEDGTKLVVTHELSPVQFDSRGVLTAWSLGKLIGQGFRQSDLFCIPDHLETVADFLRYQELNLHPELYSGKVKYNSTVEVVLGVGYVGKTSWVCKGDVRLATTQDLLCHFNNQLIHMDISTRQPTALPQNLRRKVISGLRPRFSLPVSPDIPPMYSCKFRVKESDIDENDHTNHSVYIRLCSDTAAFGTKAGRYTSLSGDVLKYPVKKIAMLFQREALLGDVLEVQSWEIPSKPVSLLFQVKRGEDDIVRCLFELYEQERAKL